MLKYLYLIVLTTFLIGCQLKKVENKYSNGNKMEEYTINKNGEKEGDYVAYFESGKIKERCTYIKGNYNGVRTIYFENGNIEIEEPYTENGQLNGIYKAYYPEGQLKIEKLYKDNVIIDKIKVYYSNGQVKEEVNMENNQENGPFTEYYQNGQIHWKGTYLNGDNEYGLLEEFDSLGAPIKKMKCDEMAICRTFWRPGMAEVNYDTIK